MLWEKSAEGVVFNRQVVEGPKGLCKYVWQCVLLSLPVLAASHRMVINQYRDTVHSMAWGLVVALGFKTHLNRLVRTRMLGGVAGVPEQSGPLCRSHCSST